MAFRSSICASRNDPTSLSLNSHLNMKKVLLLVIFIAFTHFVYGQVSIVHYNRMYDGSDTIECDVYISVLPDRLYYLDTSGYDEVVITPTVIGDYRIANDKSSFSGCNFLFFSTKLLIAAECCTKTFWYEK